MELFNKTEEIIKIIIKTIDKMYPDFSSKSSYKIANPGDLELIAIPTDAGHEKWIDWLKFKTPDESKRKFLLEWLNARTGKTIESIYGSEFNFPFNKE